MNMRYALAALALLAAAPALARDPARLYGGPDTYRSVDGQMVHRPTQGDHPDDGKITATCRDGTSSYSHHARGTCSGHGGVREWR